MNSLTPQDVFSRMCNHLMRQNEHAYNARGECCYRTSTGLQCAVGCLIPENKYHPSLEGNITSHPLREILADQGILYGYDDEMYWVLRETQYIHDKFAVCDWPSRLEQLASKRELNLPKSVQDRL